MTVFSAPDYPQFQASEVRYRNRAAVLRFREPDYATPMPIVYSALLPRPAVGPCSFCSSNPHATLLHIAGRIAIADICDRCKIEHQLA